MAENVVTRYYPHFHLGMRVMTLIWCFRGWQVWTVRVRCTTLCDKVCQQIATGRWFSPVPPVSSTNKTDRHDITETLLKVALNTIK
jgi:hypothetical protein